MKTMMKGLLILLAVAALPLSAGAQQLFDFTGQALVPASPGGALDMYGVLYDPAPAVTPLPLDFANYEYTVRVSATLAVNGMVRSYTGGTIEVFKDSGTAADYLNPSTLVDGTPILQGTFTSLSQFVPPVGPGSVNGTFDWVAGSRLNDMAPADQIGWKFFAGSNPNSGLLVTGYDEVWDGKFEPTNNIVDVEPSTMGQVKALFR